MTSTGAKAFREARKRPDMIDSTSPEGLEIYQLTANPGIACSHIYPEVHVFTPDSRRFIYQRIRAGHPGNEDALSSDVPKDYMLCDLEDGFRVRQITDELGVTAPSVSPDGRYLYYLVKASPSEGGSLSLKRVCLDTFKTETLTCLDAVPKGFPCVPTLIYPLSSISPDGRRLCASGFLGDGTRDGSPWGLIVFHLDSLEVSIALEGADMLNMHPQYCRNPEAGHDILVQHNHGSRCDRIGKVITLFSDAGADVHVVRDDGTDFRDMPWGRDGVELCQGHQCWRGEMSTAVTSTFAAGAGLGPAGPLIESLPVRCRPDDHHTGRKLPGAMRNEISRETERPMFCHFAFDATGTRLAADWLMGAEAEERRAQSWVVIGDVAADHASPLKIRFLFRPRASWLTQQSDPHPFLSPDGSKLFFNSDIDGLPQAWMATGFEYP